MPIENEIKFITDPNIAKTIENYIKFPELIEQSYIYSDSNNGLYSNIRIRKSTINYPDWNHVRYFITNKFFINNKCYEFEQQITHQEYLELSKHTFYQIRKTRYSFDDEYYLWSVDLFYNYDYEIYFCLTEVEMSDGETEVPRIPYFLKDFILKRVTDNSCSNTKLCVQSYAESLLNDCKQKALGV